MPITLSCLGEYSIRFKGLMYDRIALGPVLIETFSRSDTMSLSIVLVHLAIHLASATASCMAISAPTPPAGFNWHE